MKVERTGRDILSAIKDKIPLFHIVNTAGWFILILVDTIQSLYYGDVTNFNTFMNNTTQWIITYLYTILLHKYYKSLLQRNSPFVRLFFLVIAATVFSAVIVITTSHITGFAYNGFNPEYFKNVLKVRYLTRLFNYAFLLMFSWSVLYFAIKFWYIYITEKRRAEKAELINTEANLQMLRYQINPHFLFNTLNSIYALIEENPKSAKEAVNALAEFYRYSLTKKTTLFEPFEEELNSVKHYLEIEKKRFEENLEIIYNIDPATLNIPVPAFILNPLVENAVKYGVETSKPPIKLEIISELGNEAFIITVVNSGRWAEDKGKNHSEHQRLGIGLKNIQERLNNSYPGNNRMIIDKSENKVSVSLIIFNEALWNRNTRL